MTPVRLIFSFLLIAGFAGCGAVPRVIVLNDPLSSEEHLRLGFSYEAQGKWDLALSEYEAALKKGGPSSAIQGYLGNVYFSKKEYTFAREAYRQALSNNPENAPILNNLAFLYLTQKENLKEAERLVRKAIDVDPARKAYYLDTLGSVYLERGDPDLALSVYREAETLAFQDRSLAEQLDANKRRVLRRLEAPPPSSVEGQMEGGSDAP